MLKFNTKYVFRLEDVTNLSATILLLIIVQMYEFQEILKKMKLWITIEIKKNNQIRLCRFSWFLVAFFSKVYKFILGIIHLVRLQ